MRGLDLDFTALGGLVSFRFFWWILECFFDCIFLQERAGELCVCFCLEFIFFSPRDFGVFWGVVHMFFIPNGLVGCFFFFFFRFSFFVSQEGVVFVFFANKGLIFVVSSRCSQKDLL